MLAVLAYVDGSINSMCWENLLVVGLVGVFYMLAHARFAGRHRLMLVTTEPTPGRIVTLYGSVSNDVSAMTLHKMPPWSEVAQRVKDG